MRLCSGVQALPACQLDSDMENMVPQPEIEPPVPVGQRTASATRDIIESVGEYCAHLHEYAMTECNMCCKWKGDVCLCLFGCLELVWFACTAQE